MTDLTSVIDSLKGEDAPPVPLTNTSPFNIVWVGSMVSVVWMLV